jgi:hypothetical protein
LSPINPRLSFLKIHHTKPVVSFMCAVLKIHPTKAVVSSFSKPQYPAPDNTSGFVICVVLKNNQEIHQRKSVVSSLSKPQLSHIEARAAAEDSEVVGAAEEEEEEDSFVANIKQ